MEKDSYDLLGLTEKEAKERLSTSNGYARVVKREGKYMGITDDVKEDRINLEIEGGVVTNYYIG